MKVLPVMISGKQGSGKSTTADQVEAELLKLGIHVWRYKFAKPLYEMHDQVLKVLAVYGVEVPVKDGRLLQLLGTDWGRQVYGENVWVNCARGKFENLPTLAGPTVFLIDDLRFKNELTAFDFTQSYKVRLECPKEFRRQRCSAWRDTDTHQSEIDLDDSLGLFNDVLDTQELTLDAVAKQVVQGVMDRLSGAF